ncbi:PREDICTED: golgin subfamily A member 4-like [Nelumbo nucifera]|uniref:Golgin subfamily A member 4-like n=2 Tax=Nelumbo nucifera TaxID=4432 RepID=A0A1U8A2C3_NELNU|nr:PREDICTED: golgin subfamily A member 4-like [Nelumbo nucifera]XP_010261174.1 PREDICTED: golgin subfamily A member 4-like [Nelumbo nucifera]XP_010261175.1 PREDICTED: golgin subfamily A member 4-like [Nelumbo nucifera]XP_010261176.1 PREDICTED: golgin subfamily A member 4-like [Nelumbo nucifera]XP_010261177.1 PREDICTED: golgin subfamily A member 4-like [Nelumbo nucifera]DAD40240.1 TPA_asm: hypothetical protein HUJ06_014563 [Nelumbo nucifera]
MSRIAKWKLEKTKIKVVFRLQFHATHVPQTGWDKLFISFIPADSEKVTAKTNKANVRNGTCKWADPIYETTRLLHDARTKQYDEKLYKLVVAMGSSRSSLLGEAYINLADYADASKPYAVALPLQGCSSGTMLHVTVQLLTSKTGFREFEQQRRLREKGLQITGNQNIHDEHAEKLPASAEMVNDQTDKVNARVRFKSESKELPLLEEEMELNEEYADSAAGIDGSSNTSESLYAEKHETSSVHEMDSLKSTMSGDLCGIPFSQSPQPEKGDLSDNRHLAQGSSDWVHGWSSDYSMDNDLANAYEENNRLRGNLEVAESSILEFKLEVNSLQSHANELGAETQKFAQQLAAEIASGEELAKEVSILKLECMKFKDDFEHLKHSRLHPHFNRTEITEKDWKHLFQDMQIRWLQGLLVMEDKVREVQNKACLKYHDRDFEFLHPDLEALQCILQDLRQGTTEVISVLNTVPGERADVNEIGAVSIQTHEQPVPGDKMDSFDVDKYHPGGIPSSLSRTMELCEECDPIESTNVLKDKICELLRELEESKAERESLTRKMDQMECYYEALVQELEESQKQKLGELQSLRNDHANCLYTISSCKAQMEAMHQDMNDQFLRSSEDKRNLESLNEELERRAIAAETALKKARWSYSIAVDQLQKDLELLSFQVLSMFETNEKLISQAFAESSQPCFEEVLKTVDQDNALEKYKISVQGSQAVAYVSQKMEKELASCQVLPLPKVLADRKSLESNADIIAEVKRSSDTLDSFSCSKVEFPETKLDFQESCAAELLQCQNQNLELNKQLLGEEILFKDLKRSLHLQEELYWKAEAELCEMHVANIHLDVYSKVLQEALHEACSGITLMEERMDTLEQQLEQSTQSKELLMLRLQSALDDVESLNECKSKCIAKYNDLALQNQILEEKLESVSNENCLLSEKTAEFENLMMECREYKNKYITCSAEKTELANLLKQETLEKYYLQDEVGCVHEELKTIKSKFEKQASERDSLERTVNALQDKLGGLMLTMLSYYEQINGQAVPGKTLQQDLENKDFVSIILHLEQLQKKACETTLQLSREKKHVEEERDIAHESLCSKDSEILIMRQKFESDVQDMVKKLDLSNLHVEKLQLQLEDLDYKLKDSLGAEEKYAEHNKELLSKISDLEIQLEHVTTENRNLVANIHQLSLEKKDLEEEKTIVQGSLASKELDIMVVKKKYDSDIQDMVLKLQLSNAQVEQLQLELEDTANKLKVSSEAEEKYSEQNKGLMSKVANLETRLEHATTENQCLETKVLQLIQEKKVAEEERDIARGSLNDKDTVILIMRQKFESEIHDMMLKLQLSNALVEKVQVELDHATRKLGISLEAEEKYADQSNELLSKIANLEIQLEQCTTENRNLATKILQLSQEKKDAEEERDSIRGSLGCKDSEILIMKQKFESGLQDIVMKLDLSNGHVEKLQLELEEIANKLQLSSGAEEKYAEQNRELLSKFSDLEIQIEHVATENENFATKILEFGSGTESEILIMKQKLEDDVQDMMTKLGLSNAHAEKLQLALEDISNMFMVSLEANEKYAEQNGELLSKFTTMEAELQQVITEYNSLLQRILALESINEELERTKLDIAEHTQENQDLILSLQSSNEESVKLAVELSSLKESLRCVKDELHSERGLREELQGTVTNFTSQLNQNRDQLLSFNKQKAELDQLKQLVSDLEIEKSRIYYNLLNSEECLRKADKDASSLQLQIRDLETDLTEVHEHLLAANIEAIFTRNQFQTRMQELVQQLLSLDGCHRELLMKHLDVLTALNGRVASEAQFVEENARLLTTVNLLKSELEASAAEKKTLRDEKEAMLIELEKNKTEAATAEMEAVEDKHCHMLEVEQYKHMLVSSEEEIDNLRTSKCELEIAVIVLRAKLDEQHGQMSLLKEYGDELMMLRNKCNELVHKLSEQILKTEEFKNLSMYLKELKDQADAESLQACEKRETEESSSTAGQESLRIAFIKEQCESELQELRNQFDASKKYGEEMLLKLQDALDEVENRKKSEASHLKRNEELSLKILELETELQDVLSDKREKVKAYDRMKAELECSLISLDCCKEEKEKLEASLQECNKERTRVAIELSSTKEQLENFLSSIEGNFRLGDPRHMTSKQVTEEDQQEALVASVGRDATDMVSANDDCSRSVIGLSRKVIINQEDLLQNNVKGLVIINDHFKAQSLKSTMDLLQKELEKMKNENLAPNPEDEEHHIEAGFQGLQRDLLQLHKVNEQLGTIFPLYNEISGSGNALERVLALEIELAEAFQAKKKSSLHFQSSFLKQHNDEEAIFKSFRDINELIKDMLELKGRHTAVETELKEMHVRYSQLSLKFAEVEGERQKLLMTLKNRVPKKTLQISHSTSASTEDCQ